MAQKLSMMEKVAQFHKLANHLTLKEGKAVIPKIKIVRFREHFKLEEIIEGIEALSHKDSLVAKDTINYMKQAQATWNKVEERDLDVDLVEYADSLADLIFITFGAAHCFNMDMDTIFDEVHAKTLTRFPSTEEELHDTLLKAVEEDVEVYWDLHENGRYVVNRVDNGKVYKSAHFVLPELAELLGLKDG